MLKELRKHVPTTVATVQATFEALPLTPVYDLVFAAASLHWTKPDDRWPRVAAMLKRNGIFASFGGQVRLADSDVEQDVCAARSPFLADDEVPPPDGTRLRTARCSGPGPSCLSQADSRMYVSRASNVA